MTTERTTPDSMPFTRLEVAAMALAVLLSVACLAKGAVVDTVVAFLLLACLPILWLAMRTGRSVCAPLRRMGVAALGFFLLVIFLQQVLPASGINETLWREINAMGGDARAVAVQDKSAWLQGIGRLLLLGCVFTIALFVGACESSSRLFFKALLVSGTVALTLTFFTATRDGVPVSTQHSFTHGFVNPNNAAAYLGIMMLVTLAQIVRFFKAPSKSFYKMILNIIDQLRMVVILKGGGLLFALLMSLAGLFMTGSRAGILVALISAAFFSLMVVRKADLESRIMKWIMAATVVLMAVVMMWSFVNFGQVITHKLETNGASSNSRLDIFAAVRPMIADHPMLGTGLGSFPSAFQAYRPTEISADGMIDKAHNSYLEFAAEMGVPAFLVLMAALGWVGYQLYRGMRDRRERYVIPTLGLAVWLLAALYSLVDFPLQIPGIAALFVALMVVCVSQSDPRFSEPAPPTMRDEKSSSGRVRIRKRRSRTRD
jgi:O-antigen ligase